MIRELRESDLPGIARVWREVRLDSVQSEAGVRHLLQTFPPRAEVADWVADADGIVAWAFTHRRWRRASSNAYTWVGVLPEARGRGIGNELWRLAEAHVSALGVERVNADAVGDRAGERFLSARGFEHVRTVVVSAVDPRTITSEATCVDGYELISFADADLEQLYRLDREASGDAPGETEGYEHSFEEWRRELVDHPDFATCGSFAVLHGREVVAFSALSADLATGRGRNEGTVTARAHRGRGLATLAKVAQLRWAAGAGIERVIADNDETNAPMLAINRRLGYEPFTERRGFVREETASARAPAAPGP
jgi:RimJ/RimL family protein N-acetyltransferase/N-acetylglutamate synthase-like GNAT family acetyltransferase